MLRYAAAVPVFVWVAVLFAGVDDDSTRIPFLLALGVAVIITVWAIRRDYTHRP